jgi:hypothetical protein
MRVGLFDNGKYLFLNGKAYGGDNSVVRTAVLVAVGCRAGLDDGVDRLFYQVVFFY